MVKKRWKKSKFREILAPKRIQNELEFMKEYSYVLPQFQNLEADSGDPLHWTALILPDNELYNNGAFLIEIRFPNQYPLKPPRILFLTKIYHPNVDANGQICLPCIATELWKPTTRIDQIIEALVTLINEPNPYDPIEQRYGDEYLWNYNSFRVKATLMTRKFSLKRPMSLRKRMLKQK